MSQTEREDVRELLAATAAEPHGSPPPILALVAILRRHIVIVAAATVAGLIAGVVWTILTPRTYTARAVSRSSYALSAQRPLVSFVPMFDNASTVATVMQEMGSRAANVSPEEVMARLDATPMASTNVIELSLTWPNPEVASEIVNRIAHHAADASTAIMTREVVDAETRLTRAMAGEQAARDAALARALARRRVLRVEALQAEVETLTKTSGEMVLMDAKVAEARANADAESAALASATSPAAASRIAAQAAAASAALASVETLRRQLVSVLRIPKIQAEKLTSLYDAQAEMRRLDLDVAVAEASYQAAAARLRAFVAESEVTQPAFAVVDEAVPSMAPSSRNGVLKIVVSVGFALIIAAFVIAYREAARTYGAAA